MLFRAHVSWWQDFTTPFISFLSLSFSTQNPQLLPLIYLKRPLNWPKIRNGLLFQTTRFSSDTVTKQICYRHKSVYSKWLNSLCCVDMILAVNLLSFLSVLTHWGYFFVNYSSSLTLFWMILMLCIWLHRISFRRSKVLKTCSRTFRQSWSP